MSTLYRCTVLMSSQNFTSEIKYKYYSLRLTPFIYNTDDYILCGVLQFNIIYALFIKDSNQF